MKHLLGSCRVVWLSLAPIKDKTLLKESRLKETCQSLF